MAPKRRDLGQVEAAYKAWTDALGDSLTARQRAAVAQALALARMMDASPDEPLSAKASASRELRAVCDELRDTGHVGGNIPDPEEVQTPEAEQDGVSSIQAQRAKRQREAMGK